MLSTISKPDSLTNDSIKNKGLTVSSEETRLLMKSSSQSLMNHQATNQCSISPSSHANKSSTLSSSAGTTMESLSLLNEQELPSVRGLPQDAPIQENNIVEYNPNNLDPCGINPILPHSSSSSSSQIEETSTATRRRHCSESFSSNQSTRSKNTAKLKLLPLAILVFYNVSGGPFGIEPSLRSAGNLYTIIGFIVVPFIWSIPEALITAELGSIFCQDGSGGVAWVDEAFGEQWGLLCGYLSWVSGATDNAIYPTLFLQYVISVLRSNHDNENAIDAEKFWFDNDSMKFAFVSILSVLLGLLNYRGLEIIGNASIIVCVISMSPFLIMIALGIPKIDPSRWLQLPDCNITMYLDDDEFFVDNHGNNCELQTPSSFLDHIFGGGGVLWGPFLNNMFWNFNYFDSASNFAAEVDSVSTTYPRGIFLGLVLSIAFYLVPLLVVTGSTNYEQHEWTDGQLGQAAIDLGGKWLGSWIVFAAGISNLALFEAELSSDSYQLMGMAERGHLPKIFAKRSKFGTPTVGIIVGILVIVLMSMADFIQLVELLNFNYSIALLMEYAAFVKLRWTRKDLERPYRIPIPDWCALLFVIPPSLGILVVFSVASPKTYIFLLVVFSLGFLFHYFLHLSKLRKWLTFVNHSENLEYTEGNLQVSNDEVEQIL